MTRELQALLLQRGCTDLKAIKAESEKLLRHEAGWVDAACYESIVELEGDPNISGQDACCAVVCSNSARVANRCRSYTPRELYDTED